MDLALDFEAVDEVVLLQTLGVECLHVALQQEVQGKGTAFTFVDCEGVHTENGGDAGRRVHQLVPVVIGKEILNEFIAGFAD